MSDDVKEARQNLAWSSREGCDGECAKDCHICDLLNEFELAVRVDEWMKHRDTQPARLPGDHTGGTR